MHSAPSVRFPVGRCGLYGVLLVLLAVLGGLVLGLWFVLDGAPGVSTAGVAGGLLWLTWVCFVWREWRRSPVGQLRWSASERHSLGASPGAWRWHSESCAEGVPLRRVVLAVDWQSVALLRLQPSEAPACWVWVERTRNPALWNDLRRALVAARS